jgi:anti-anti-sigma factor
MTTRELEVTLQERDGAAVLALHGDVNASAEAALQGAYAEATSGGEPSAVVLDFADVEYINSTGIALIVGLLAQARAREVEVRATGLSDHYREIFEITRLADFMTIEEGDDDA